MIGWHIHRWSKWMDEGHVHTVPAFGHPRFVVERIVQTKRCEVCNLVKARRA